MPEELKAKWMELGEEIFSLGKKTGRETVARAMLKVAGDFPEVVDEKVVKNGKIGVFLGYAKYPPPKKGGKKTPPPQAPLAMTEDEIKKFPNLKQRQVDRGQLETFLRVTKTKYTEEELDELQGGEVVGVYNEKLLVFKKQQ